MLALAAKRRPPGVCFSWRIKVVIVMIASMTACTPNGDSPANSPADKLAGTSCSLESNASPESCSTSLQLTTATLWFGNALSFTMAAEYQACYQRELMTVKGSYRHIDGGEAGQQLELQATSVAGSNIAAPNLIQPIGMVQLNAEGSRGSYTDFWAIQHMPSYAKEPAPVASLNCEQGL